MGEQKFSFLITASKGYDLNNEVASKWTIPETTKLLEPLERSKMQKSKYILLLLIVIGFIVYNNSLLGGFVWDDEFVVLHNQYIKGFHSIKQIFTENIGTGTGQNFAAYRPLQLFSYVIDYSFWKLLPIGYHMTNIILHIAIAMLFYYLIILLFQDSLIAFFAGLLFLIHPVNTETVNYISNRSDLLATFFILSSFILYIKLNYKENKRLYVVFLSTYLLALFSKENSLILPALLLLYNFVFEKKYNKKIFLPIFIMACMYIILRSLLIIGSVPESNYFADIPNRVPGFFAAIAGYMWLLFFPLGLHMEYGNKVFNITDPKVLLGSIITAFLLFYAVKIRKQNKLISFSIGWFFISLLPTSALFPLPYYMAEHYLYLPVLGFFLIIGKAFAFLYKNNRIRTLSVIIFIAVTTACSILTVRQNMHWKDSINLYERVLKCNPYSPMAYNNLGCMFVRKGDIAQAKMLYKKAIELDPCCATAYTNLASIYFSEKKYGLAVECYNKAKKLGFTDYKLLKLLKPYIKE